MSIILLHHYYYFILHRGLTDSWDAFVSNVVLPNQSKWMPSPLCCVIIKKQHFFLTLIAPLYYKTVIFSSHLFMLNVFFLFNYKASCLIPAKRKSPLHGQHMWGKCSQQPVPTYPLRYLTWWIRTEPLPQCDSTCSVWRIFVPSLRKRTTTIQVY